MKRSFFQFFLLFTISSLSLASQQPTMEQRLSGSYEKEREERGVQVENQDAKTQQEVCMMVSPALQGFVGVGDMPPKVSRKAQRRQRLIPFVHGFADSRKQKTFEERIENEFFKKNKITGLAEKIFDRHFQLIRMFVLRNQGALWPATVDVGSPTTRKFIDLCWYYLTKKRKSTRLQNMEGHHSYDSYPDEALNHQYDHHTTNPFGNNVEQIIGRPVAPDELVVTRFNDKIPTMQMSTSANTDLINNYSYEQLEFMASLAKKDFYTNFKIQLTVAEQRIYNSLDQETQDRLANNYDCIDFCVKMPPSLDDRIEQLQNSFWNCVKSLWCKKKSQ